MIRKGHICGAFRSLARFFVLDYVVVTNVFLCNILIYF